MAGQFDEQTLRLYLLGQLTDDSQQTLEKSLLTDDQLFEELLVTEDELIDEYLGGRLSPDERERFEKHFLSTPDRRQKLRFGRTFKKYVSTQAAAEQVHEFKPSRSQWSWTQAFFSSPLRIAACAIIVLAVAIGVWRVFFHESDVDKGLMALNAAYREQRPLEARISALSYAPFSQRRGSEPDRVDSLARNRAELTLTNAVSEHPNAAAHHALGEVYLAKKLFEDAIKEFEEAFKTDSLNPQLLSDLGAALLEKSKIDRNGPEPGKGLEELARSLEYLNKALGLDPNLLEALFNRALCHQYMVLPRQAEDDWREYFKKDSTSPWAEEARRHLKLLEEQRSEFSQTKEQLLRGFLDAYQKKNDEKSWRLLSVSRDDLSGTNISQQLLDRYLELSASGRKNEAALELQALSYAGELEVRKADEHYNSDIATVCRALTTDQQKILVQARNLMKMGYEMYAQSRLTEALEVFGKAARTFNQSGDHVEVNHAKYWTAYCYLEGLDTQRGLAIVTELARQCARHNYRWLMIRTLQSISGAKYNLKEYSKAIDYSIRALGLAEQMGDGIGTFNALDTLTELYRSINNYPQSMNAIDRSQPLLNCCAFNPIKLWRHYAIVALAFYSAGLHTAAIEYQREALRRALAAGETSMISLSYAHLGLMYGKLGSYGEGLRSTQLAYETAAAHSNEARGKEMMAYSSLQTGHLYRDEGECDKAIESYDKSIELYEDLRFPAQLYQAHKGRLVCYITGGKNSLAREELVAALGLIEKNRSTIFEGENRNKFFDVEQSVYDLAIGFTYEKLVDGQKAFAYSEDSRARSLLDLMLRGNAKGRHSNRVAEDPISRPLPLSEIERRLPDNSQILEYAVLTDKIVMWVIDKETLHVKETRIAQADLDEKVRGYLNSISDSENRDDPARQGKELFDLLIKPIEGFLDSGKQLDIVPDKVLNALPFSSLVSTASGKYLIEDYCINYSPSSTVFVLASAAANRIGTNRFEKLLSVGNPTFDRNDFPELADLPEANREAREIAGYYDRSLVLIGAAAKKRLVISEMFDSDVVHLALHALEDDHSVMQSKLVLAKDQAEESAADEEDGTLQAREIYSLKLPRTRLLVLSACQTGTGRFYGGEGTFSLARAFLVSGVPFVVASLWPVDSESTADLMISFHRYRKQKHWTSAQSLQQAQLDMLAHPNQRLHRPYYWASFFALGGYTKS